MCPYSSDRSTTLRKEAETRENTLNALDAVRQLLHVAAELLAERKRGGILKVSTANLDDVLKVLGLLLKRIPERFESRQQRAVNLNDCSHVHGRGESERVVSMDRNYTRGISYVSLLLWLMLTW